MRTVAILAALNLENSITEIVKRTKQFVDEVIVVTDGSSDNTNQIAIKAGAKCPEHTTTRGKGFAVIKGITYSKKFNPDIIILMDADGQHLPEEIPIVMDPIIKNDFDMVVGSRMKGELKTSVINKIGNFGLKIISYLLIGKWMTDTESGFRSFKAKKLYELPLESRGYEIEGELLIRGLYMGFRVIEVPITIPKAIPGVTVSDGIKMGLYKIKLVMKLKFLR